MKVVGIGLLRLSTLPLVIAEVVYIGKVLAATIPLVIMEDMLIEVDLGHKRPATISLTIGEQELILKR